MNFTIKEIDHAKIKIVEVLTLKLFQTSQRVYLFSWTTKV